jgi:hypothetical protein
MFGKSRLQTRLSRISVTKNRPDKLNLRHIVALGAKILSRDSFFVDSCERERDSIKQLLIMTFES